jgi:hypothetical protein
MMMIVEQSVECELAGETEVLGENLPQRNCKVEFTIILKTSYIDCSILCVLEIFIAT